MHTTSLSFTDYKCFRPAFTKVLDDKLLTLIIGRNNSGKTQYLDVIRHLCEPTPFKPGVTYQASGQLSEADLRKVFFNHNNGGKFSGNHWDDHGRYLIDASVSWTALGDGLIKDIHVSPATAFSAEESHCREIEGVLGQSCHRFSGKLFRRLLADRDIRPEPESPGSTLEPDGKGATNILRRYLLTSKLDRDLIRQTLRKQLAEIFASDGEFTEIVVRKHEDDSSPGHNGEYEIYFTEKRKPQLVSLSDSGSGLKTVILVLLLMTVIPAIDGKNPSDYVFAFEELENNLHPALLRRLLQFIERYSINHNSPVFLTSHSSVALDFFGLCDNAHVLHVKHDGERASGEVVEKHFHKLGIVSELGAKPSDLLQANGIIWVEGPSDCIYINRWIDVYSHGQLKEGRDYQCAFYGGALLARVQFCDETEAIDELVNLLRLNSNIVVVCDSDRPSKGRHVKPRVARIQKEVKDIPSAMCWVTEAREIENYLTANVINKAFKTESVSRSPEQFESFFRRTTESDSCYWESAVNLPVPDKSDLAAKVTPHISHDDMRSRFDLFESVGEIVELIKKWNA